MTDTLLPNDGRMKPILIIPPETMSNDDVKRLNDNGICTVVCKDPLAVKFLDPIPSMAGRDRIEQAAIELSRRILNWGPEKGKTWTGLINRGDVLSVFFNVLQSGTSLSDDPTPKEIAAARQQQLEREAHQTKMEEVRKIAREEARAERAAAKGGGKKS